MLIELIAAYGFLKYMSSRKTPVIIKNREIEGQGDPMCDIIGYSTTTIKTKYDKIMSGETVNIDVKMDFYNFTSVNENSIKPEAWTCFVLPPSVAMSSTDNLGTFDPQWGIAEFLGQFSCKYTAPIVDKEITINIRAFGNTTKWGSSEDSFNVTIVPIGVDKCAGVTCSNKCVGTDLYAQKCSDGTCNIDIIKEKNSITCGYTSTEIINLNVESNHPYSSYYDNTWVIKKDGVKSIKIFFDKIETDENFDFVQLLDKNGNLIVSYTGIHNSIWSQKISSDTVKVRLVTDKCINKYGFKISKIEVTR